MARSLWEGAIAFGLVDIPVSLTSAESRPDLQFHMVDNKNHSRIRCEWVNADTGEEVSWDRLVKGGEHDDGKFILLTDEDLGAVQPKLTKTIEITEFIFLDEIDPLLFDKPYDLEPDKRGLKACALLREAIRESRNIARGHPHPRISISHVRWRRCPDRDVVALSSGNPGFRQARSALVD